MNHINININKNNDENFKISVYENIKDKINDPFNIINNNNIYLNENNPEQNDVVETNGYIEISNKFNSSSK